MTTKNTLVRTKIAGYTVLHQSAAEEQVLLFRHLISEVSPTEKEGDISKTDLYTRTLFHDGRCRCWLVESGGKKYIFKLDKRDRHRFDYLAQSFFCGSNAFRLMRTLHRAFQKGFRGAAEIFLVADKRRLGCTLHSYFLQEYVEGEDLQNTSPSFYKKYRKEVKKIIKTLHKFGCAHGDAHRGNFILEKSSGHLKTIDIGGKIPSAPQKATDRLRLQKEWGIKNTLFDWGYFVSTFHRSWRHFLWDHFSFRHH